MHTKKQITVILLALLGVLTVCSTMRSDGGQTYYVNDMLLTNRYGITNDEWCTTVGNDANDGLSPASPKTSVQSVLSTYVLGPGDVVRIDTGTYNLTANIEVTPTDAGSAEAPIRFEVSPYGVEFNRGDLSAGSYAWYINGANSITLSTVRGTRHPDQPEVWMKVRGAYCGVVVHGNYCQLSRIAASGNVVGIAVDSAQHVTVENCVATAGGYDPPGVLAGMRISGSEYVAIKSCTTIGG